MDGFVWFVEMCSVASLSILGALLIFKRKRAETVSQIELSEDERQWLAGDLDAGTYFTQARARIRVEKRQQQSPRQKEDKHGRN